ncbi:MAG: O-succinylhomoserine sulfhydrylase [Gammaproteobacteria bacterium]|nr:MAG: O-succinylhomoserine sulfhydrylase [Gammaproteobacteria bacterium]
MEYDNLGFGTRAVRSGHRRSPEGEQSEPIYLTSSFVFADAAEAAARFAEEVPGNIYSRFTNPTVRVFEERLAALEGGERCIGTASGMAAILSTCMALLKAGDHIVSSRSLFGSTVSLFEKYLSRFGITTTFVDPCDLEAWQQALRPETRLLFFETPSNPLTELIDIAVLAGLAHDHGALLAVDNCFCTPALQRPLEYGADLVIHSATKFLDGQGRCVGGAVVGSEALCSEVHGVIRTAGPAMSPFNAWVFLKGLETLNLRMRAHSAAAEELAHWLDGQPAVERVNYPGLASHPQHELAVRQQIGFGGLLSFEVAGGREAAWRVIDAVRIISITANLGGARSTITHPASTTHGRLSAAQRAETGIREGLVRVSVGLEEVEDLKADLAHGLARD